MKKIFSLLALSLSVWSFAVAQEAATEEKASTEVKEEKAAPARATFARATFKSTQLINFQTTEMTAKGNLQFRVAHHFSNIWNKGAGSDNLAQMFGLNSGVAHTNLSFDYSPVDFLNVGLSAAGGSRYEGSLKFKLLKQQTGARNIPVSVAWYSMANVNAAKNVETYGNTWNKFSFLHQLLIARKFNDRVSLQIMPTMIHFNMVPYGVNNSNNIFSLGFAGRYKLTSNKAITCEYTRQLNMYENVLDKTANILNYEPDLLSLGLEFNTGNHVFEFFVGSTTLSSNIDQLSKNTNKIKDYEFAMGFHLNRAFILKN